MWFPGPLAHTRCRTPLSFLHPGDTDHEGLSRMDSADIICTTPEKFDAMTRRNRDRGGMRFFNEVGAAIRRRCCCV